MAKATKLTKLRMDELSGVDAGSNLSPGWIVEKSKAVKADVESFEKAIVGIFDGLASDDADLFFSDASDEIVKARKDVLEFIAKDLVEEEAETAETEEPTGPLAKFKAMFKTSDTETETETETSESAETETETDTETDTEETDTETETEETETETETDTAKAREEERDELIKGLATAVQAELEPIRDSVGALVDRVVDIEKFTARRSGLDGQESVETDDDSASEEGHITKALRVAMKTGKVDLT